MVRNLHEEIVNTLERKGKTLRDIKWVGNRDYKVDLTEFIELSKRTYYIQGYSTLQYPEDLIIKGEDFWIEVDDYDGSLGLDFKLIPVEPKNNIPLESLNQLWVKKELVGEDIEYTCINDYDEYYYYRQESRGNSLIITEYANGLEDIQELAGELNKKDRGILERMNEGLKQLNEDNRY